ncbi:ComEC/Rec2 family competence protein [Aeromonas media]|uniref:ComEC/Rec2 family competence protein n=1 Tax=Aeromonas media TaxID=651 RepID=UPI003BB68FB6
MLWPERPGAGRNNDSCVVQISDGRHRLLLSGDIEQEAERRLLALESKGEGGVFASTSASTRFSTLASAVLVSPHHGSRTSSTPGFVAAVNPDVVIHSAGDRNQWQFPRPEVVARYQGARQWVTGQDGAILIEAGEAGLEIRPDREQGPWYRRNGHWWRPRLWH